MLCTCVLASRCCCRWKLRTGVIAITIITLVVCAIWIAVNIWDVKSVMDSGEDGVAKKVIVPCIIVAVVSLWALSALVMAVAVCFSKRRLMIPWLVMTIVVGVIDAIALFVAIAQISKEANNSSKAVNNAIIVSTLEVIIMLFFAYWWIIVISFYFYNMKEAIEWDADYGRVRKPVYTGTKETEEPIDDSQPTKPLNPEPVANLDAVEVVEAEKF